MNKLSLNPLPYGYDALMPVISKEIMELHHDKHHLTYVNGANAAIDKIEKMRRGEIEANLRELLRDLSFNYNGHLMHQLFWQNMRPAKDDNRPEEKFNKIIEAEFGSFEAMRKEFGLAATTVEGSGWAVLWQTEGSGLAIMQLEKHNLLGVNGWKPILALDVWEHAYYLDYKNNRGEYVENWWKVVNWEDVAKRYHQLG